MTARQPLSGPPVNYGIEDRPALWDTEGPDGMCSCGEDAHPGFDCDEIPVARGYRKRVAELEAVVYDLHHRLAAERERADRAEARASVAGWSA